ncbi:hypothetical protein SAMN02745218_01184 [Desulfofundulus australicus DSM 11792]|uniref:Uncharacterized protein n=1 Tax=Desulfofundulus australicus DSM 11792 TaxID=1121425 RepID=A0A1M4XVP9_9FIRM|nr:hypothetical protein [Desulfofundulus australicus]SHE97426.1 hypothetical protein SAMN02745218_01184 [Desulfofundulus australicus DSM 11792]
MLSKLRRILTDERGISTPEAITIAGLAALMGFFVWATMRPFTTNSANTLGGKVQNAVSSNNPTW